MNFSGSLPPQAGFRHLGIQHREEEAAKGQEARSRPRSETAVNVSPETYL
jgi:hypothetical protein